MAEVRRIEVGFVGQQVITLKVSEKDLKKLRDALPDGGWQSIPTDDGDVDIDLGKVAFLRVASGDHSVGFRK